MQICFNVRNLLKFFGRDIPRMIRSYDEYSVKPEIIATDNAFKLTLPDINSGTKSSNRQSEYEE